MPEDLGPSLQRYIQARFATDEAWRSMQDVQEQLRVAERETPLADGHHEIAIRAADASAQWVQFNRHLHDTERDFLDTAWRVATAGMKAKE